MEAQLGATVAVARGDVRRSSASALAPWRPGVVSAVLVLGAFVLVAAVGSAFQVYVAATIAIFGLAAVGQGWLMSWTGQVSLGGGALFGVGAFSAALVSTVGFGQSLPVALIASLVGGGVVGAIICVPGLRFRGVYLLLATLALQYVVQFIGQRIQDSPKYVAGIPTKVTTGGNLVAPGTAILLTAAVLLAVGVVMVDRLYRSQAGREWAAIKENEVAAGAMGIDVRRRKASAFIGSSMVTALAGGLYAYYISLVTYTAFDLNLTLQLVIMVFVGGSLLAVGPVIGAAVVTLLPYALNDTIGQAVSGNWYQKNGAFIQDIIYGLVLALILLYARGGLTGIKSFIRVLRSRNSAAAAAGTARDVVEPVRALADAAARTLLTVEGLHVQYPGSGVAVNDVTLGLNEGEIFALLGRNGAGKSSILKAIGGFPARERAAVKGTVRVDSTSLHGRTAEGRARRGVVLVPEQHKVYPALTVSEHFAMVGARTREVDAMLEATGLTMLAERRETSAGSLSGGERQFLALAVAVLRQPKLLLVDEMTLGLAPIAVNKVADALRQIRTTLGCSILIVEQNARVAVDIADRIGLLESGRLSWSGPPANVPESQLESSYFGPGVVRSAEEHESGR